MIKNELVDNNRLSSQDKKRKRLHKNDNQNIESYLMIHAENNFQSKNYLVALGCYLSLLSFDPENARVWNKIAVTFFKLGEFNTAEHMSQIAYKLINEKLGK